jgi:hypothetical protein
MTAHDRNALRIRLARAQERAERARWQGDYAGAIIAAGDARKIMRRLADDMAEAVR